jgi:MFS family permease
VTEPAEREPSAGPDPTAEPEPGLVTGAFLALAGAALVFFIGGGVVLPVVGPFAIGPLESDAAGAGLAFGAFAAAALLMRPVVGWAADRFGRRPLLIGGALLSVAALALHLVVDSLALFVVARGILGVGEAFFFVAVLRPLVSWYRRHHRPCSRRGPVRAGVPDSSIRPPYSRAS